MANWTIRRLDKAHDRSTFDCGQPILNGWFGFRSLLDDPRHLFLPLHEIRKLKLDPL